MRRHNRSFWTMCLDQNVISMLARAETPFWRSTRERMVQAADNGKLVCPIPPETMLETLGCRLETRIAIRDLSLRLSRGVFFKPYFSMLAEETLALVRPEMTTCPVEPGNWNDNIEDSRLVEVVVQDIKAWKAKAEQRVVQMTDPIPTDNFSHKDLYYEICLSRAQDFRKQIRKLILGQSPDPNSIFIDVCRYLEREKITQEELNELFKAVTNRVWDSIPLLCFHSKLSTVAQHQMSTGGKYNCNPRKYSANDEWDRTRLAVGVAYCDVVITENSLAAVVRQCGLAGVMGVNMLGISEKDLIAKAVDSISDYQKGTETEK